MKPAISYIRVSTGRQSLGLDAQRDAIARFCAAEGFDNQAEFVERQSGKGFDALERRPELAAAMKAAKKAKATVLVAKLDRLSRNVAFISTIMEKRIPFVVCNLGPNVDPFMLHIHASIAEKERKDIAERTRAALQSAKLRGKVLGNADIGQIRIAEANENAERLRTIVLPIRHMSSRQIARILNKRGIRTPRNNEWRSATVLKLIDRLEQMT